MSHHHNHGTNNPAGRSEPEYSRSVLTILPEQKINDDEHGNNLLNSRNIIPDEGEIKMNEQLLRIDNNTSTINTLTKSDATESALLESSRPPRHPYYHQPVITETTSELDYSHGVLQLSPHQAVSQHQKQYTQAYGDDVTKTDQTTFSTSQPSSTFILKSHLEFSNRRNESVDINANMELSSGDLSSTSILQKRQRHHPQASSSINKPEKVESKPSLKLLVVDDSGLNRKMMRRLLEAQGHVCEEAADGQIAVNMVKSTMTDVDAKSKPNIDNYGGESDNKNQASYSSTHIATFDHYDAILMDFVMPVMNGPMATSEIRKLGYTGPIMGVTGNVLAQDRDTFMAAGASHYFTKPLDVTLIVQAFQGNIYCF